MKYINNYINESKKVEYRVSLIDVLDEEDLPISVSILVENKDTKNFEDWLNKQEGDIFAHANGGNVEY
jgi:hypothetical protein